MQEQAITTPLPAGKEYAVALGKRLVSHRAQALRAARSLVGGQDAEDVVQEAIARVLGAAARGATIEHPRAYLNAAVRQVAVDHLAATHRHPGAVSVDGLDLELASNGSDPQQVIELRATLHAIGQLPSSQRDALVGTVMTDHDQTCLAARLCTTPAGVRQLVRRARVRLRDAVGACLPWLAGRGHELTGLLISGGQTQNALLAVSAAALIASPHPPAPNIKPPTPPAPPVLSHAAPPLSLGAPRTSPPAVVIPRPIPPRVPIQPRQRWR